MEEVKEAPLKVTESRSKAGPFDVLRMMKGIHGAIQTQLIFIAAERGIADLLGEEKKSVKELAKATGTIESRLYRFLRALAAMEIVLESSPGYFELTSLGDVLRSESPLSLKNLAIMIGSEWHGRAWLNLSHSLKFEKSAFEGVYQEHFFEYLKNHPRDSEIFDAAMTTNSIKQISGICSDYEFPRSGNIVDVGGGQGYLLYEILNNNIGLKGILFDQIIVVKKAFSLLKDFKLNGRCEIYGGSFMDGIPEGGDIYILKNIIHDFDDDIALKILSNCRKVMTPGSKLLVIEIVLDQGRATFLKSLMDMEMMVLLNGKERTEHEFRELFYQSGLNLRRIIPTRTEVSILEGFIS